MLSTLTIRILIPLHSLSVYIYLLLIIPAYKLHYVVSIRHFRAFYTTMRIVYELLGAKSTPQVSISISVERAFRFCLTLSCITFYYLATHENFIISHHCY